MSIYTALLDYKGKLVRVYLPQYKVFFSGDVKEITPTYVVLHLYDSRLSMYDGDLIIDIDQIPYFVAGDGMLNQTKHTQMMLQGVNLDIPENKQVKQDVLS